MNSPVKRAVSLVVVFSMLFTGTASADLSTAAPSFNSSEKNFPFSIELPFDLGTVEEIRTPASGFSGPVVVMVQTLHGHYETALKIKGLIDYLHSNHAVRLLFAEGGSGPLHPEYLRFTEDPEKNAEILDELVRKGEMTGADLALSQGRVKGIGIENAASYKSSYEAFKNVLGRHAANEKALESARLDLDRRASLVIAPELRAILSRWLKFGSGQLELLAAVDFLRAQAPSVLGVDFEMAFTQFEWPQVTRLVLLSELGKRQNQESWAAEKSALIEKIETLGLDKSFPGFLEGSETAGEPRRKVEQFMSLAAPAGLKLTDYPQAVYKAASKVLESEIDSRQLYEEISRLFERILSSTVRSPEEQILVEEYKQLRLADKLLRLELSPQEWRDWHSLESAPAALNTEALTETLKQAEGFYLSLEAREQSFLESIDQTLRSTKSKTAVLVTGGFHGREMMDKLESRGIGSVLVTPHISGDLEQSLYQKIMLRGATLEQTLLSNGAKASVSQGWDVRSQSEAVRQILKDQGSEISGDAPYFSAVSEVLLPRSELRSIKGTADDALWDDLLGKYKVDGRIADTRDREGNMIGKFASTPSPYVDSVFEAMKLSSEGPALVVDAGHGTGNLLFRFASRAGKFNPDIRFVGIEASSVHYKASEDLLKTGVKRKLLIPGQVELRQGNFNDQKDLFRKANVVYYAEAGTRDLQAFSETLHELQPGARVVALGEDQSQPERLRELLTKDGAFDAETNEGFPKITVYTRRSELRTESGEYKLAEKELDIKVLFPANDQDKPLEQIVFVSDNTGTMVENYGEPLSGTILSDAAFLLNSGKASVVINSGDPLRDLSAKTYKPLIDALTPEMRTRFHIVADGGSRRIGFKEDGSTRYFDELESWPKERRFAYARVLADAFYKELKKRKGRLAEGLKDVRDEEIDRIREERIKALEALGPEGWGETKPDEAKFIFDLMPENYRPGWGRIFVYDVGPKVSLDAPAIRDYLPADFMPGAMEEVQKTYPEGTDDLYVVSVPGAVDMARVSKVQGVEKTLAAEVYPKLDAARPVLMVVIGDGDNDIPTFSLKSQPGLNAAVVPVFLRDSSNYADRLPRSTWVGAFKLAGTAQVLRHLAEHAGKKISDIPPLKLRQWVRSELRQKPPELMIFADFENADVQAQLRLLRSGISEYLARYAGGAHVSPESLQFLANQAVAINPDFNPEVPGNKLSQPGAAEILTLIHAINRQVFLPADEYNTFATRSGRVLTSRWVIKPGSWRARNYLGRELWSSEGYWAEGGVQGNYANSIDGKYVSMDVQSLERELSERYRRAAFEAVRPPFDRLSAIIKKAGIQQQTYVNEITAYTRGEEERHAEDSLFGSLLPDAGWGKDSAAQTARAILKTTSFVLKMPSFPNLNAPPANTNQLQIVEMQVTPVIELSGQLGGILKLMKERMEKKQYQEVYLLFLHQFLRSLSDYERLRVIQSTRVPGPMSLADGDFFYSMTGNLFFDSLYQTPEFNGKTIQGLEMFLQPFEDAADPETRARKALSLLEQVYAMHFLTDSERQEILDAQPRSELRRDDSEEAGLDGRLEGLDLYEKVFSKAPDTTLRVGRDIAHTGALQASAIIRGIQAQRKAYDAAGQKDRDVFIIFATGNTQWLGLTTLASILDSWGSWDEETRDLLIANGVDLSDKPDMGRIFATHLDTIFPQSRDDYYSYANELHNMFDKLGISREKRRMFYGDVKNDLLEPGADNKMDPAEFEKVQASIDEEGLKLNEFLSGQLASDHAQYAYLDAVNRYTKKMSEFVLAKGPDIALFSAGPSYEGKGHFAFNEAGTPFDQGLVMALLSYHAAAGNIKDRGGMQHFRTPSGAIKIGGATLGPKEIRSNNPVFITIINGKEKRESVRSLVERTADIQYPMTALQSGASGSVLIMESASGSTLRYFTNTWDFVEIPAREWNADLRAKLFVRLSKETGKPVSALTVDDWLDSPGKDQAEIAAIRTRNLIALTALQSWEVLRDEVVKTLKKEPLKSEQVPARLGLRSGDEIVHIGPHLDDLSLAAQFLVSEFSKQGHRLYSYYTAPGYTAVSDEYVLSALGTLQDFNADELAAFEEETRSVFAFKQNEEKYLRQLIKVLADRDLVYDPMNYDTWSQMPAEEQRLRAKLLFLRLNFESSLKGQLSLPERVRALRDALEIYIKAKPHWGSSEITVMQKLKVALRFVEEQTELMSRGVGYEDIFFPFQSSWYALERKGTARQSDIDVIKDVIRTRKPRMVIVNGEGFMDHGAHSITEMTVKVAVKELYEEAALPDGFRMFFYRGVWDRAEITGRPDQILVALGEEELNENKSSFVRNYPSQAPALVPDASVKEPMFFSDQVVTNARETLAEWAALNGRATDDPALQGILAFDMIDFNSRSAVESFLAEVVAKKTELDRVQVPINRASLSKIIGSAPPYADLSGEPGEQFLSVLAAAGFPFETVLTKEEIDKTKVEVRSELRTEDLPGDPELLQLSGSASDFDRNPFPAIEKMAAWFAQHRWFMEKGNTVKAIEYVDAFILGEENGSFVHGLIVRLKLANAEGQEFTKQYFIPVIVSQAKPEGVDSKEMVLVRLTDGERYLSLAEHQGLYQKMLLEHFQNRKEAGTWNQGRVVFSPSDSTLQGISASDVSAGPLGVSTSNVLTKVTSAETSVVSKTYKDMRGVSGQGDRVWPANTEVPKYEALVKGNYPYMPPLYGTMDYVSASGQRTALGLMMKAVKAETEAGGVFWEGLTRFMKTLKASDPESGKATQKALEGASIFARELAGTVAEMHTAFLKSGSAGFTAASASGGEIQGWERSGQQHLAEALSSLDQRISANPGAENLKRLRAEFVKRSEAVKDAKNALDEFEGVLMKAPVHGDLSTAQGLIEALGDAKLNHEYWDMTERGAPADVASKAKALIQQVRWLDFEGPPAKESVAPHFDQRENWIKDAAGVLEGFWYIANIQLFNFLELNPQERPEDREEARKASLVLAGYADVSELARGINPEVIRLINQWVTETTNAFLDGYFDTLEKEGYGNAILSRWNRQTARDLVDYYLMERAMHEFHYEFYAREWGWEGIPGTRILQLTDSGRLTKAPGEVRTFTASDSTVFGGALTEVAEVPKKEFFSPIDAAIPVDGVFFPFHHMRHADDWGVGNFYTSKAAGDFAHAMGYHVMQDLPFTYSSAGNSPYSVLSALLLDPVYLSAPEAVRMLERSGIPVAGWQEFLNKNGSKIEALKNNPQIQHQEIINLNLAAMRLVWDALQQHQDSPLWQAFESFKQDHQEMAEDDLLYLQLKTELGGDWRNWEAGLRDRDPVSLRGARERFKPELDFQAFVQYVLDLQKQERDEHYQKLGVSTMVDMAFAPPDAEIWKNPAAVGMHKENSYRRDAVQGVPGKKEAPVGQLWNFSVYDWSNPAALALFIKVFKINLDRADYLRVDHTLGLYRIFVFLQKGLSLAELGIEKQIADIRERALRENTEEAKGRAVSETWELIRAALLEKGRELGLPPEVFTLVFDENGQLRKGGNMVMAVRKVPRDQHEQKLPIDSRWQRLHWEEDDLFEGEPKWDTIRLTPNERAQDNGDIRTWLFPEDGRDPAKADDQIRLGYFRLSPGETAMSELARIAQETGKKLIFETLGTVPEPIQRSSSRFGNNYYPLVYGLDPSSWYNPLKIKTQSGMMTFNVADTGSPEAAWAGLQDWFGVKGPMVRAFFPDMPGEQFDPHMRGVTPEIHEKLLQMVYDPQGIYPQIPEAHLPLIALLGLIDIANLPESYRLNIPGQGGQWINRLPHDLSLENLTAAAKGETASEAAEKAVQVVRSLQEKRARHTPLKVSEDTRILRTTPDVREAGIQIRTISKSNPASTAPFFVEAAVQGDSKRVDLVVRYKDGREARFDVRDIPSARGENPEVSNVGAMLRPEKPGIYEFHFEIEKQDQTREVTATGRLIAVPEGADLNPMSPDYVLTPDARGFRSELRTEGEDEWKPGDKVRDTQFLDTVYTIEFIDPSTGKVKFTSGLEVSQRQLGTRFVRVASAAAALLPLDEQEFRDKASAAGLRVGDRYGIGTAVYTFLDIVRHPQYGMAFLFRVEKNGQTPEDGYLIPDYFQSFKQAARLILDAEPGAVQELTSSQAEVFAPLVSKSADQGLITKHLEGERAADMTADEELWNLLPADVREKIERVIAEYRDHWKTGDIEREDGFSNEKRAVKIAWKGTIRGEEIDGIIVSGVLFNRDNIGEDFRGLTWGSTGTGTEDLDEETIRESAINVHVAADGRPDLRPAAFAQKGGHGGKTAVRKFRNARTTLPAKGLRTPVAVGYALYTPEHIKKDGEPLGVFISAHRKTEKRFKEYQEKAVQGLLKGYLDAMAEVKRRVSTTFQISYFDPARVIPELLQENNIDGLSEVYGRELRKVIDAGLYPHSPHFANFEADPSGRLPTTWHDLGGWEVREELTPEQAFGYAYMTLTYAMLNLKIRFGNRLEEFYKAGYIHPYQAFFKGFFHDQLQNPDFNLGDFSLDHDGRSSLEYAAYDAVYRDEPGRLPPLYKRLDQPFVKVLRQVMGMPVSAEERASFKPEAGTRMVRPRPVSENVLPEEWEDGEGVNVHRMYEQMRQSVGMEAVGPQFVQEYIVPELKALVTPETLDEVVEYGAGAGTLWDWAHDGFADWYPGNPRYPSWIQTDMNMDALRMSRGHVKKIIPVDLREEPIPFKEKAAAVSWAGLDTLPVPEIPAVVRSIAETLKPGGKLIVGLDMGASVTAESFEAGRNGWVAFPYFTDLTPGEGRPSGMMYLDWSAMKRSFRPGPRDQAVWPMIQQYMAVYTAKDSSAETVIMHALQSKEGAANLQMISRWIEEKARATGFLRHIAVSRPALHIERIQRAAEAAGFSIQSAGEISKTYFIDRSAIPGLRPGINHIVYSEGMVVQQVSRGVDNGKVRVDAKFHLLTAVKTGEPKEPLAYTPLGIGVLNGGKLQGQKPKIYQIAKMLPAPGVEQPAALSKAEMIKSIEAAALDALRSDKVRKPAKRFEESAAAQQIARDLSGTVGPLTERDVNSAFSRARLGFTQSGHGAEIAKRLNEILGRSELRTQVNVQEEKAPEAFEEENLRAVLIEIAEGRNPSVDELEKLERLMDEDAAQSAVTPYFGTDKASIVAERIELLRKVWPAFREFWQTQVLSSDVPADSLWRVYLPLAQWTLSEKRTRRPDELFVVGIGGAIGSGKTTLSRVIALLLNEMLDDSEGQAVARSLDDYYLPKETREKLREKGYAPGMRVNRALPGTQDVDWVLRDIQAMEESGPETVLDLPSFSKLKDQHVEPYEITGKVGIFVFEGWLNGAPTDADPAEAEEGLKRVVAEEISKFAPVFNRFDALFAFPRPSVERMILGRIQQDEHQAKTSGRREFTDAQIESLIRYWEVDYWQTGLTSPSPRHEDVTLWIEADESRNIRTVRAGGKWNVRSELRKDEDSEVLVRKIDAGLELLETLIEDGKGGVKITDFNNLHALLEPLRIRLLKTRSVFSEQDVQNDIVPNGAQNGFLSSYRLPGAYAETLIEGLRSIARLAGSDRKLATTYAERWFEAVHIQVLRTEEPRQILVQVFGEWPVWSDSVEKMADGLTRGGSLPEVQGGFRDHVWRSAGVRAEGGKVAIEKAGRTVFSATFDELYASQEIRRNFRHALRVLLESKRYDYLRSELRAAEERNPGWLREELGLSEDEVISLASSDPVLWRMRDLHGLLSARFPGKLSTLTAAGGSAAFAYSLGLAAPYEEEIERVYDQFLGYAERTSEALALTDFRMLNSVYEKLSVYLGEPVVKLSDRPVYQRTFLREIPERLADWGAGSIAQTAEGKPHLAVFLKDRPNTADEEQVRQGLLEWLNMPDSEGKTWNLPVFRAQFLELFPEYDSPRFDHGFLIWTLDLAVEFNREDDARGSRFGGVDTFVGQSFGFTREKSTRKMRALREHLEALALAKLSFENPEDAADLADYVYQPAALGQIQDLRKIRALEALSAEAGRNVDAAAVLEELGSPELRWNIPEFYKRHSSITWLRTRGYHTFFYAAQMEIPMRRILRERYDRYAGNMKLVAESFGMDPKAMRDFYAAMGMDPSLLYVSRGHFLRLLGQDKQVYLDRIQKKGWTELALWKEEVLAEANAKLAAAGGPKLVLKNISHADIVWGLDLAGEFLKEFKRLRETEGMTMVDASRMFGFTGEKGASLTLLKRIEEGIREQIREEKKLSVYVFDSEDLRARLRKAYEKDKAFAVRIKRSADGVWETLRSGYYYESHGGESAFVSGNISSIFSKVKGPYKITQQDSFLLIEQAAVSAKAEESLEPAVRSELRMDPIKPVSPVFAAQFRNYSLPAEDTELRDRQPEKPAIVLSPEAGFIADSREAALYFALDRVLGSHPVLGIKDIDPQDGYLITKASDLPAEDVFKSWFLVPRAISEDSKTRLFQQLKPGGILIMSFEEGIAPDPSQFDQSSKAALPPEIANAVYGSVKTQVQRRDDVIPYVIVQKSRSELREAPALSERDALSIPSVRLPFIGVSTGRADYDTALILAGMADPLWEGAELNDYRLALRGALESYYQSEGGEGFKEQVSKVQSVLRENKQVIALFAHIEDLSADSALRQIFETAAFLAEENQAKAHYVVLTVDRTGDAGILRDKLLAFLREKYPEDAGLRNQLYARLPVAVANDPAITRLLPKGAASVWVDWNSGAQDSAAVPEPAREKQVRADQLPSGEVLQFDETNRGYGVSLLQAALLLLQGEEDSRLQQVRNGIYAQSSRSALAGIGQVLKALQLISKSA